MNNFLVEKFKQALKNLLTEGKYSAKNTLKFANELDKLIREITSESYLQKKIFDEYWKENSVKYIMKRL